MVAKKKKRKKRKKKKEKRIYDQAHLKAFEAK
jgi:hypothetical protein